MKEYLCIENGEKFIIEAKDWEDIDILDEVLDELEADCILFIESKGYTVIGY